MCSKRRRTTCCRSRLPEEKKKEMIKKKKKKLDINFDRRKYANELRGLSHWILRKGETPSPPTKKKESSRASLEHLASISSVVVNMQMSSEDCPNRPTTVRGQAKKESSRASLEHLASMPSISSAAVVVVDPVPEVAVDFHGIARHRSASLTSRASHADLDRHRPQKGRNGIENEWMK